MVELREPSAIIYEGWTFECEECDPDKVECLAKSVFDPETSKRRYLVKTCVTGRDGGNFFNPLQTEAAELGRRFQARSTYDWRKVSKRQFEDYLLFLKTGNSVRLRQAERAD